jgi:Uma2 family endonuclease
MNGAVEQWPKRHRISVDEYYRMAEVGLLQPGARVELIEGEIIDMAPIGSPHAGIVNVLTTTLVRAVGDRAVVSVQLPVRLSDRSEPQPDVALLKPRADFYRSRHPTAADVLLLIEVSDTTLRFDRGEKLALYARHGVPEVWIVDIQARQVHCMRGPAGEAYQSSTTLNVGQKLRVAELPDVAFDVSVLFD